jgi:hypothetical protein
MASKPTGRPRGRPKTAKPKIPPRERGRPKINLRDSPERLFLALKTALVACRYSERMAAIVTFLFSECAEVPPENEFAATMPAKDGMIAIGLRPLRARGDDKKKLLQRIEGRCSTFRKKRVLSQTERPSPSRPRRCTCSCATFAAATLSVGSTTTYPGPKSPMQLPSSMRCGVSDKVLSLALVVLLLGGRPGDSLWQAAGAQLIVIDTLVHN